MSKIIRATAALALLSASLPALGASATATRSWQYKPESNAGLEVRNLIGDVRIERGSLPGFHVTARTTIEAESQAEADRLVKLVEFRTADVGAGSRFDVRLPKEHFPKIYWEDGAIGWFSLSYVEHLGERIRLVGSKNGAPAVRVDLVIRAPAGAKLEVDNTFGDAVAQGYSGTLRLDGGSGLLSSAGGEGELELDNGSGEAVVSGHRGRVVADTGSGSVKIADCECEIVADTGSGSVDIGKGKGSVSADTGSGDVEVAGFAGPLSADTGSGSVKARGLADVKSLEIDTGSGSVSVEGDLSALERVAIDTGSGSVSLRSSAQPSLELRIETGSGGIDVNAPGSTVRERDDVTWARFREGAHAGEIETGSGGVDIDFR
ncbi:MAG TPA: DUF4097 family beta strand repeat-containing protein [Steroidobacteraceae bacterium]|nr:DUF4097 family beta strand repeat-containing protein [Steroidobacteraceae bacterium]